MTHTTVTQGEPAAQPEGPAAVAVLAAGVGALALGVVTTLAEASPSVKSALALSEAVGPLSGKVAITLGIWLLAWLTLWMTAGRRVTLSREVIALTGLMLALGLLGTFPVFFELFAS